MKETLDFNIPVPVKLILNGHWSGVGIGIEGPPESKEVKR